MENIDMMAAADELRIRGFEQRLDAAEGPGDSKQCDSDFKTFLLECMKENLNHARHVETEIHTFTGIYMAVVAGVLAFGFSTAAGPSVLIGLYAIMLCAGLVAFVLIRRWYTVFDNHMRYAERGYYMLEELHLKGRPAKAVVEMWNWPLEKLQDLADLDPVFAFWHPRRIKWLRTRWLVYAFHLIIILVLLLILVRDIIVF